MDATSFTFAVKMSLSSLMLFTSVWGSSGTSSNLTDGHLTSTVSFPNSSATYMPTSPTRDSSNETLTGIFSSSRRPSLNNATFNRTLTSNGTAITTARRIVLIIPFEYLNIIFLVLSSIGILSNLVNIIVLALNLKQRAWYTFLLGLGVADLGFSATYFCNHFSIKYWRVMGYARAVYKGHVSLYIVRGFGGSSTLITIAMTVERLYAIVFPFRAMANKGKACWRAKVLVLVCFIIAFACRVPRIFLSTVIAVSNSSGGEQLYATAYSDMMYSELGKALLLSMASIFEYIPAVFLFVANTIMVVSLKRAHETRLKLSSSAASAATERQRALLLILIAFLFLTCESPGAIIQLIINTNTEAYYNLAAVCNILYFSNHCINVFVYCFCSREYRDDFIAVFTGQKPKPGSRSNSARYPNTRSESQDSKR